MAKKRKKQHKNNKMPPLHWVDKLIYIAIITILIAICMALLFNVIFSVEQQYFQDSTVIAYNRHASVLWYLPTFFSFFIIIAIVGDRYTNRYPIFGIPNFRYGPSQYPRIYPLFSKDKPKKKNTPARIKNTIILWSIIAIFALSQFATLPLSFYGRDVLRRDASIAEYNMFNKTTEEYSVGHITAVKISSTMRVSKGRHRVLGRRSYGVTIGLTTTDGNTYYFASRDFRNEQRLDWLNQMLQIKSYFPSHFITYDREYIDYLITQYNMTEEEITLLYQLFDMEK